jgi:alpha/beta superfamily hydrolase
MFPLDTRTHDMASVVCFSFTRTRTHDTARHLGFYLGEYLALALARSLTAINQPIFRLFQTHSRTL